MSDSRPHLFQSLTWNEFKTVWAIAFVSHAQDFETAWAIDDYATPGLEGPSDNWIEIFYRVIRYLHFAHGYSFEGLIVNRDGDVLGKMVQRHNFKFFIQMQAGKIPDPESAIALALEDEQLLRSDFNMEPLKEALSGIRDDVSRMMREHSKEAMEIAREQAYFTRQGMQLIDEQFEAEKEKIN